MTNKRVLSALDPAHSGGGAQFVRRPLLNRCIVWGVGLYLHRNDIYSQRTATSSVGWPL